MSESFAEDLGYLAKVTLITLMLLSLVVIYKQKVMEGIILITFCIQCLLIWILITKFYLFENITIFNYEPKSKKFNNYLRLIGTIILFIIAISLIFRAVVIIQHSIINYGSIKSNFHFEIIVSAIIGISLLIVFLFLIVFRRNTLKNINLTATTTAIFIGLLAIMLNTHISHNF